MAQLGGRTLTPLRLTYIGFSCLMRAYEYANVLIPEPFSFSPGKLFFFENQPNDPNGLRVIE